MSNQLLHDPIASGGEPECIVLAPRPGAPPSPRPAVRIFLGSEPAQHRAERVFVWSIEQVRDPTRRYEITLMKDLPGFQRRGWTTRFTNYRFAIPALAGGTGRAIYNDVDQVYRRDPAELFDLPFAGHGFLAVAPDDPSVMLLDCECMGAVWTLEAARTRGKRELIERAASFWGQLDRGWNARDDELPPGTEKCIHFTTLHTQPWRPFPERFVYQPNPLGDVWHDLERSADEAGFLVHTRERPSGRYAAWHATHAASLSEAAEGHYAPPAPGAPRRDHGERLRCDVDLAELPQEDLPWVLDDLFGAARRRVDARACWDGTRAGSDAFTERLSAAARRHPNVHWTLQLETADGRRAHRSGGLRDLPTPPRVWVLADDRPGNTTQSIGLADALGWPYELKDLRYRSAAALHNRLLGATDFGVDASRSAPLAAPWPDLVIAAGRRNAPVAQWVRARSGGHTKVVLLGRKGGDAAELFDLVVTPSYTRLFPHPKRLETAAPLHRVDADALARARALWADRLATLEGPRIAVLVGGTSGQYALGPDTARRLGEDVMRFARETGGHVLATTSRRLAPDATRAFCSAVEGATLVHRWLPDASENPYLGLLAWADAFVITGDSESMLAEAASLGRPVYVYPLPVRRSFRLLSIFREWVWRRGRAKPAGPRGTPRPQRGLERLCARWIDRGWVRPSRDLDRLHRALYERGVARPFGEPLAPVAEASTPSDHDAVVARVRALMGLRADGSRRPHLRAVPDA